jgi:hypothetical protein
MPQVAETGMQSGVDHIPVIQQPADPCNFTPSSYTQPNGADSNPVYEQQSVIHDGIYI